MTSGHFTTAFFNTSRLISLEVDLFGYRNRRRAVSWHQLEGTSEGATEGLAELLQGRQ